MVKEPVCRGKEPVRGQVAVETDAGSREEFERMLERSVELEVEIRERLGVRASPSPEISTLVTRNSGRFPAERVNLKIMKLRSVKDLTEFLRSMEQLEGEKAAQHKAQLDDNYIIGNIHEAANAQLPGRISSKLRENLKQNLKAATLRRQKLEVEEERRVEALAKRVLRSEELLEEAEKQRRLMELAGQFRGNIVIGRRVSFLLKELRVRKEELIERRAATLLQERAKIFLLHKLMQREEHSRNVINRFLRICVVDFRRVQVKRAARLITDVLISHRRNFQKLIHWYIGRVKKCQHLARSFLECTKARTLAIGKIWTKLEVRYALQLREQKLAELRDESTLLASNVQRKGLLSTAKLTREVILPQTKPLDGGEVERVTAISFPGGMSKGGGKGSNKRSKFVDVDSVMDHFLSDVIKDKVMKEREGPVNIQPLVHRTERAAAIRELLAEARGMDAFI